MVALRFGPAGHNGPGGTSLIGAKNSFAPIIGKVIVEDSLHDTNMHQNHSPGLTSALHSLNISSARSSPNCSTICSHNSEFLISFWKFWVNLSTNSRLVGVFVAFLLFFSRFPLPMAVLFFFLAIHCHSSNVGICCKPDKKKIQPHALLRLNGCGASICTSIQVCLHHPMVGRRLPNIRSFVNTRFRDPSSLFSLHMSNTLVFSILDSHGAEL